VPASMNVELANQTRVTMVKEIAHGICLVTGPKPECLCQGNRARCHSAKLYSDFAIGALLALERAGYSITPPDTAMVPAP